MPRALAPSKLTDEQHLEILDTILDPVVFADAWLREDLYDKQKEIMRSVELHERTAVKACHSSGKTRVAADLTLWWLAKHTSDAVVITTAPTGRQVEKLLWGDIHAVCRKSKCGFPPPNLTELKINEKRMALGFATEAHSQGVSFQGWHGAAMLIIVDEAPGVGAALFDAIEGVMASGTVRLLKLGNPVINSGDFHNCFTAERALYNCITIGAFDTPNLRGLNIADLQAMDEAELAKNERPYLVTRKWVRDRFIAWGPEDHRYQSRVLGQFPEQGDDALIWLAWLEQAKRPAEADDNSAVDAGLDIAGPGEDETVLMIRQGRSILEWRSWPGSDPRGEVVAALMPWKSRLRHVCGDSIGTGYYFCKHLEDLGFPVVYVNVGNAPVKARENEHEKFANLKAQLYMRLQSEFKNGGVFGLEDEETISQLSSIRWGTNSRGQTVIESKADARKRGVHSPDRAEALMLSYAGPLLARRKRSWLTGKPVGV